MGSEVHHQGTRRLCDSSAYPARHFPHHIAAIMRRQTTKYVFEAQMMESKGTLYGTNVNLSSLKLYDTAKTRPFVTIQDIHMFLQTSSSRSWIEPVSFDSPYHKLTSSLPDLLFARQRVQFHNYLLPSTETEIIQPFLWRCSGQHGDFY